MSTKKTSIAVNVTGDARDAIKAINQVTGELFTLQKRASMVGSALGSLAAKGVGAVVNLVRDYAGAVMDMSDSTQKFEQTLSFAGLDTTAIKTAKEETRKYADQTVYDLTTVQNTTAQLAANGVGDYVGLTKAAGNLNAVAGGNADTFKSVAMVLTQTAGAGKLTTENWNQLSDAIPGAAGRLMDAMRDAGAYTGNFREAMEKGEITADEFNQAIMSLGMEDVAQQAATSTKTMEGAFGNLQAAITGKLADAFDLVKPMVTDAMSGAATAVSDWGGRAIDAVKQFGEGIANTDVWQRIQDAVGAVGRALQSIGDAIGSLLAPVQPVFDQFGGSAEDMGQRVGDALGGVAGIIQSVSDKISAFGEWVSRNAEPITTALVGIGTGLAVFKVAGIIQTVSAALEGFNAAAALAAAGQWLLNIAMSANPIMLIISLIAGITAGLAWFFTQTEAGQQIWSDFTTFIGDCVQAIGDWFGSLPESIGNAFQSAADWARNTWSSITDWFNGIWDGIVSGASRIVNRITQPFKDAAQGIRDAFNGIVSFVQGIWDRISGIFSGIGDAAKSAWDTITSWLPFNLMAMPTVTPLSAPLVTVGDPDMQGASNGGSTNVNRLARLLDRETATPTVVNNITYNVTLPAKIAVGEKRELIRWIVQGMNEARRQVA